MKKKFVADSLPLKIEKDELVEKDGTMEVPVTVMREMVYDYGDTKAFKPKEEIAKAARYAGGIAITRSHPESGIVTDQSEILGFFSNPTMEDTEMAGILKITDKSMIADVKAGKLKEVSGGFFCDLNRDKTGDYNGTHYDARQENIVMNHVAIVEDGRCSLEDGCGIQIDEQTAVKDEQEAKEKIGAKLKMEEAQKDTELNTKLSETVLALRTELDTIQKAEKAPLIAEIVAAQDTKSQEDLGKLSLDELKQEKAMIDALTATRLAGPTEKGKTALDEAYAKIGARI
jgi:hypothetical protein